MGKNIVINEFTFTHLVELGKIAVEKGDLSKEIIEKMLVRVAKENGIALSFIHM